MFIHLDDFVGVNDRQVKSGGIVLGEFCANSLFSSNEIDANAIFTSSLYRSQDCLAGSVVTPHSIEGNTNCGLHQFRPPGSPIVILTSSTSLSRSKGL